ncbi:MAG: hypothetical protein ACYSUT_01510 [Planctomycetota bacterium]
MWTVGFGQDVCEGYDPNTPNDPNEFCYDDPYLLDNRRFEEGCSLLTRYDFLPPTFWQRNPHPESTWKEDCYAGLRNFFPDSTDPDSAIPNWDISGPFEGENFLLLSTGGFNRKNSSTQISGRSIKGSSVSQKVFLSADDTIQGAFYFGTLDYTPFNDYGRIVMDLAAKDANDYPNSARSFVVSGSYCDIEMVGSRQSTEDPDGDHPPQTNLGAAIDGWVRFSHTVEPNQVGPYYLTCEVVDDRDNVVNSYYAVDGLYICKGGLRPADLNSDCEINLEDFSIISEAWLSFCPDDPNGFDPNDITSDPNIPCQLADINNDWYVDVNDLMHLTDDWLYNASPPVFLSDPILLDAQVDVPISESLIDYVHPIPEGLIFSLLNEPNWLTVETDGTLSGTPTEQGENELTVQVESDVHWPTHSTLILSVDDEGGE